MVEKTPSSSSTPVPSLEESNNLISRFVASDADIVGYAALSLFFIEIIRSNWHYDQNKINERIKSLDENSIAQLYRAAANRIVEQNIKDVEISRVDDEIRNSRNYHQLKDLFSEKIGWVSDTINEYNEKQNFIRQVIISAVSTAIVAVVAIIVVFAPDFVTTIRNMIG